MATLVSYPLEHRTRSRSGTGVPFGGTAWATCRMAWFGFPALTCQHPCPALTCQHPCPCPVSRTDGRPGTSLRPRQWETRQHLPWPGPTEIIHHTTCGHSYKENCWSTIPGTRVGLLILSTVPYQCSTSTQYSTPVLRFSLPPHRHH